MGTVVVKIGGSLMHTDKAARLLAGLADTGDRPLAIVPGGGAFADAVRLAQSGQRFSDTTAHRMALLAMDMSAWMLADLAPALVVAGELREFRSAWSAGLTPVWAPAQMASIAADIPPSWDVTSDSLAAWLANVVRAEHLLVVKSCAVPEDHDHDAATLARAGIVDACFPRYVAGADFTWRVVSGDVAALAALASA